MEEKASCILYSMHLTNVVRCVAGGLQGVPGEGLLGEAKVSQLQNTETVWKARIFFALKHFSNKKVSYLQKVWRGSLSKQDDLANNPFFGMKTSADWEDSVIPEKHHFLFSLTRNLSSPTRNKIHATSCTFGWVEQVLGLEVSVCDVHVVQVLHGDADVLHQLGGLWK